MRHFYFLSACLWLVILGAKTANDLKGDVVGSEMGATIMLSALLMASIRLFSLVFPTAKLTVSQKKAKKLAHIVLKVVTMVIMATAFMGFAGLWVYVPALYLVFSAFTVAMSGLAETCNSLLKIV